MDSASAYEQHAESFLRSRSSKIGSRVISDWAKLLVQAEYESVSVLDVGCGGGYPVTQTLVESGFTVYAIDSSPTLVNTIRHRLPAVEVRCERVQDSDFFNRQFTAIVAVGVVFLLPEAEQIALLTALADRLKRHPQNRSRMLFSAPKEAGKWIDQNTGLECHSLGYDRYCAVCRASGLAEIDSYVDRGQNHYYSCVS
jgi:2-polyprenyl-3-methyl-5-hydroxy-6-metoxy-1,4-benzoquinol methylase